MGVSPGLRLVCWVMRPRCLEDRRRRHMLRRAAQLCFPLDDRLAGNHHGCYRRKRGNRRGDCFGDVPVGAIGIEPAKIDIGLAVLALPDGAWREHGSVYRVPLGPLISRKYLDIMVGVTGFEPATYTSRT